MPTATAMSAWAICRPATIGLACCTDETAPANSTRSCSSERRTQSIPIPQVYRRDGTAIAIADDGGRNEVYELNLPSFTFGKKLFGDARYDVDDVIANSPDDDFDGIVVVDRKRRVDWLNPEFEGDPGGSRQVGWRRQWPDHQPKPRPQEDAGRGRRSVAGRVALLLGYQRRRGWIASATISRA